MTSSHNITYQDYFLFTCEPSKYDTDVVVRLEGRKLSFAMQYSQDTIVDGQECVKTTKLTSAFTLPFDAVQEQFQVEPNPGKGQRIKIFKVAPSVAEAAARATAAGANAPSGVQVDCDINILSKS